MAKINAEINKLGGFLDSGLSAENAVISMYCLKEHLPELFDILFDAITNVSFREDEVKDLEKRTIPMTAFIVITFSLLFNSVIMGKYYK